MQTKYTKNINKCILNIKGRGNNGKIKTKHYKAL